MEAKCLNCRFWDSYDPRYPLEHKLGRCRKNAPLPVFMKKQKFLEKHVEEFGQDIDEGSQAHWPETRFDEWCGQYEEVE